MASQVRPGIFIGDAKSLEQCASLGITHVLSMAVQDTFFATGAVDKMELNLRDEDDENVLQHLPRTVDFIVQGANTGGKVLVNCLAGMSRSAAVVCAFIMRTEGVDFDTALASLQERHPVAYPNEGFQRQLRIFGGMGCVLDRENKDYKAFNAEQLSLRWQESGYVAPEGLSNPEEEEQQGSTLYRCRKCRRLLASSANILDHDKGEGNTAFSYRKRDKYVKGATDTRGQRGESDCSSIFCEPMRWMEGICEGVHEGKLVCANPACGARLGAFNWAGEQCNCGSWVVPFFQLQKSKIDHVPPARDLPKMRIARPLQLNRPAGPAAAEGRYRHLIFDCDGVLVNTEAMSCGALHGAILEATGVEIPHAFPEDFYGVFGMDVKNCCAYYKETMAITEPAWDDLDAVAAKVTAAKEGIYRDLTRGGIEAFDGARALADRARAAGLSLSVGSSGTPEKIEHNLTSSGLRDLFEHPHIVSAKMVARGKPFPDVYVEAMRRAGCEDPSSAIVIEDAVHGLRAARAAGALAVGVTNSLPREHLEPHADVVVDHLDDLDLSALPPRRGKVPAEEEGA